MSKRNVKDLMDKQKEMEKQVKSAKPVTKKKKKVSK